MATLQIKLDGDGCWPDLSNVEPAELEGVALLPDGEVVDELTGQRKKVPIVLCRVRSLDPNRFVVIAQVKLDMLEMAVRALRGRIAFLEQQRAAAKGEA